MELTNLYNGIEGVGAYFIFNGRCMLFRNDGLDAVLFVTSL